MVDSCPRQHHTIAVLRRRAAVLEIQGHARDEARNRIQSARLSLREAQDYVKGGHCRHAAAAIRGAARKLRAAGRFLKHGRPRRPARWDWEWDWEREGT